MRIVGFKEFMSLPEGTVFAKYSPCMLASRWVTVESMTSSTVI